MEIQNEAAIRKLVRNHANARRAMAEWIEKVQAAQWTSFTDALATFNAASNVCAQFVMISSLTLPQRSSASLG